MRIYLLFFILAIALCSCIEAPYAHFKTGQGDVGQYILLEAISHGIIPINTNGLPVLTGHWSYGKNSIGVGVRMSQNQCQVVASFLQQAFGQPDIRPLINKNGNILSGHYYGRNKNNGGIQFNCSDGDTVVAIEPIHQK